MPEPVVDLLETVEIEEQHGQRSAAPEFFAQKVLETVPVAQPGQRILAGQPQQPDVAVAAFRYVLDDGAHANAALVVPDRQSHLDRKFRTVLAAGRNLDGLALELGIAARRDAGKARIVGGAKPLRHDHVERAADHLVPAETEQIERCPVDELDPTGEIDGNHRKLGGIRKLRRRRLRYALAAQFHMLHDHGGKTRKRPPFPIGEVFANLGVGDAERAYPETVRRQQRRPGIEADERFAGDDRQIGKPRVEPRVGYHEDVVRADRMVTKGVRPAGLLDIETGTGLEPLPILFDQRYESHACGKELRGKPADAVETVFRPRAHDAVSLQRVKPPALCNIDAIGVRHLCSRNRRRKHTIEIHQLEKA